MNTVTTMSTATTLSDPTLGLLIQISVDTLTRDELGTLLLRADLEQNRYLYIDDDFQGSSKHGLVRQRLRGAQVCAQRGDNKAHHSLLTFVRTLVEQTVRDPEMDPPSWFPGLCESLLGDGYQLTLDRSEKTIDVGGLFTRSEVTVTYQILPTDSSPVPLAGEINALERDLLLRGYTDVVNNYRQAVTTFGQHQYEAANGQLRTTLEALVMRLAEDKTNYNGNNNAGQGGLAINHMITTGALPERDGGKMLLGLWNMIQTNGPHPGQSTADESRMRMQLITATARFLLNHFPA